MKEKIDNQQNPPLQTKDFYLPKPSVTRIHPAAFSSICILLVILGIILVISIFSIHPAKNSANTSSIDTNLSVSESHDDERWYQHEPNNLPNLHLSTTPSIPETSVNPPIPTVNLEKKQEAVSLQVAMDSPIKAPINDLSSMENHSFYTAPAENDAGPRLSEKQIARLQQYFDDKKDNNEHENFLKEAAKNIDDDYLHASLKKPLSPYELQAGSLIPATLVNGINSELPGQLTAMVNYNVYDSIRGQFLLIPQGTKLILTYDANVAYGQSRVLVAVKRLIFPNGNSLDLKGMPAVDEAGYSGLHDQVDNHYFRTFGNSAMMGIISGGLQLSQPQQANVNNSSSISQIMAGAMGQQIGDVAMGMMNKNLEVSPTLKIRPGYEFNVQVTADMVFPGSY